MLIADVSIVAAMLLILMIIFFLFMLISPPFRWLIIIDIADYC